MPRNGSGVYSLPAGLPTNGETSNATDDILTPFGDLETDMNTARPVVAGGTGATSASGARTNLGLAIGTDVQAYDPGLASIAGLTTAADRGIYTTASDTYAVFTLTSAGRALLDDADAATQRTTLGLGALATLASVDTAQLADDAVTIAKIADAAIVTEGEGISSNDNDTTLPTSAAVKDYVDSNAGGAMVFLASVDASADATIAFTQFDGATYDAYKVIISNLVPSVTSTLLFRTSTDGGSTYDSGVNHYAWSYEQTTLSGTPGQTAAGDATDSKISITGNTNVITGDGLSLEMTVLGPHLARNTQVIWDGVYEGTNFARINGAGVRNSSADVDAIQFLFGSGNIASGTITLYGLKNS